MYVNMAPTPCYPFRGSECWWARPIGRAHRTHSDALAADAARASPLIDVPEHPEDRVVLHRTNDLLVPDQDVGKRVERQRDHVGGHDVVALLRRSHLR